jgi:hypothetical protein
MFLSHSLVLLLAALVRAQNFTLEAENAVLQGVTVETTQPGFTGIYLR